MIVHDGGEYRVVVLAGEHFIMIFFRPIFQRPVLPVTATTLMTPQLLTRRETDSSQRICSRQIKETIKLETAVCVFLSNGVL
jgi:hypothetical protein